MVQDFQVPKRGERFEYVIIPADTHYPIECKSFEQVELENDTFIKMVKNYFASASSDSGLDRAMLLSQLNQHAKKDVASGMDSKTMDYLLSMTSVDIMSISVPNRESQYVGVSLYCDDKGKAKNLPVNERATKLGLACGLVGQTFNGDVFLSRMFDDGEDHWFRMNFSLGDVSSTAEWVKKTAEQMSMKTRSGANSLSSLSENFLSNISGNTAVAPSVIDADFTNGNDAPVGGEGKGYKWTQNNEEIELTVSVVSSTANAKPNIKVVLKTRSVEVTVNGEILVNGELLNDTIADESTWSYSKQDNIIVITLWKKVPRAAWSSAFKQIS